MAWNGIRNKQISFMGIPFKKQNCPSCGTVVEFMALGIDQRRNSMICPSCAEPELFTEEAMSSTLKEMLDDVPSEDK